MSPADPTPFLPEPGSGRSAWRALREFVRGAFVANAALKFVALVLALTVFILVHSDEDVVAGASVDVYYTLPKERVLVTPRLDQVRITVKGSRRRIKRFHSKDLDAIHLDLRTMRGGEVFFQPDMLELPDGISLVSIDPASMPVRFEDRVPKEVPIVVETAGQPARGYRVERITVDPPTAQVSGAASFVAQVSAVRTQPVALAGEASTIDRGVALSPPEHVELEQLGEVRVRVVLAEEQGTRELGPLPITLRPGPGVDPADLAKRKLVPDRVQLVLRGAVLRLDALDASRIVAQVTVSAADLGRPGKELEIRIAPALPGIGLELEPTTVTLAP